VLNSRVAKVVSTTMWFWIMYRGYHDLPHMIVRGLCLRVCHFTGMLRASVARVLCFFPFVSSLSLSCHSEHARPGVLSSAQYLHQPWEHGDHPPDLSDEDDVFLANLKAQTAK